MTAYVMDKNELYELYLEYSEGDVAKWEREQLEQDAREYSDSHIAVLIRRDWGNQLCDEMVLAFKIPTEVTITNYNLNQMIDLNYHYYFSSARNVTLWGFENWFCLPEVRSEAWIEHPFLMIGESTGTPPWSSVIPYFYDGDSYQTYVDLGFERTALTDEEITVIYQLCKRMSKRYFKLIQNTFNQAQLAL